jgi:hypothetical protein
MTLLATIDRCVHLNRRGKGWPDIYGAYPDGTRVWLARTTGPWQSFWLAIRIDRGAGWSEPVVRKAHSDVQAYLRQVGLTASHAQWRAGKEAPYTPWSPHPRTTFRVITRAEGPAPDGPGDEYDGHASEPWLPDEEEVVWLVDPAAFRYVREAVIDVTHRQRRPFPDVYDDVVAYATLQQAAQSNIYRLFKRRVWQIFARDTPDRYVPAEGVDPLSIRPGRRSRRALEDA